MDRIRSFFGGGNDSTTIPSSSVLAEWNKYSDGKERDVESGMAEESTSLFSSTFSKITDTVSSAVTSTQNTVTEATSMQNWYCFGGLMLGGLVMLFLAFTVALPMVVISPAKFAFSFSVGSLLVLSAFTSLKGWKEQLKHMFSKERILFSAAYIGSLFATLYSATVMHSYLLSLLFCVLQMTALIYYIVSYFPGGVESAKAVMFMFYRGCLGCCGSLFGRSS